MEISFELVIDALMTVSLLILAVAIAALVVGWFVKLFYEPTNGEEPAFLRNMISRSICIIFFTGYVVGFLYQFLFIGFETTAPIDDAPVFIYQFHCHFPYNAEHHEYLQSLLDVADICQ
jgi:flagellar biosynthesis protein FliQ